MRTHGTVIYPRMLCELFFLFSENKFQHLCEYKVLMQWSSLQLGHFIIWLFKRMVLYGHGVTMNMDSLELEIPSLDHNLFLSRVFLVLLWFVIHCLLSVCFISGSHLCLAPCVLISISSECMPSDILSSIEVCCSRPSFISSWLNYLVKKFWNLFRPYGRYIQILVQQIWEHVMYWCEKCA